MDHVWEETGEGKRLAGIALNTQAGGGGTGEIGLSLEESEVGPAGQETEPGEDRGRFGSEEYAADGVEKEEDGGEVFDAHLHQTFEDGHCMFGDELLEGDEEGSLD